MSKCVINYDLIKQKLKERDVNLQYFCSVYGVSYFTITKAIYEERNVNVRALLFFSEATGVPVQDLLIKQNLK